MKQTKRLIGCISTLEKVIHTRFFFLDSETKEINDVTYPLYKAIEVFNENAKAKRNSNEYAMLIPYEYQNGLVEYSFGCGLSHYLQENVFEALAQADSTIGFPLAECRLSMYVPSDVKDILEVTGVFDERIKDALLQRY